MRLHQFFTAGMIIIISACNNQIRDAEKKVSEDKVMEAPQDVVTEDLKLKNTDSNVPQQPVVKTWQEKAIELKARYGVKSPLPVHSSISLDVLPMLTIVAEGKEVCNVTEVAIEDLPKIEIVKVPNGLSSNTPSDGIFNHGTSTTNVLALYSGLYCDYMNNMNICEVVSNTPIYYSGNRKTVKLIMHDLENLPEIHFSDDDIICRQRYRE